MRDIKLEKILSLIEDIRFRDAMKEIEVCTISEDTDIEEFYGTIIDTWLRFGELHKARSTANKLYELKPSASTDRHWRIIEQQEAFLLGFAARPLGWKQPYYANTLFLEEEEYGLQGHYIGFIEPQYNYNTNGQLKLSKIEFWFACGHKSEVKTYCTRRDPENFSTDYITSWKPEHGHAFIEIAETNDGKTIIRTL